MKAGKTRKHLIQTRTRIQGKETIQDADQVPGSAANQIENDITPGGKFKEGEKLPFPIYKALRKAAAREDKAATPPPNFCFVASIPVRDDQGKVQTNAAGSPLRTKGITYRKNETAAIEPPELPADPVEVLKENCETVEELKEAFDHAIDEHERQETETAD